VDLLVVDHLAGRVNVRGDQPSAEIFSDPLDPALRRADEDGHLIWGWSEGDLARWNTHLKVRQSHTVPFSVASDRLETMAHGVDVTISVTRHPEAEAALGRVREDADAGPEQSPRRAGPLGRLAPFGDLDFASVRPSAL
jgi:hypothetical protein